MSLPSSVDSATRRRETALWQGAGASIVAKGVSAVCQLAQVPVALGYLGAELFGLWMTLVSVLAMMAFADLGIGAGVQNEAASLVGKDRADEARKTCVNGLAVLGLVGVGLIVVLVACCAWLPWAGWIGIRDAVIATEARQGCLVLIILFCANLPLTALARLAYGLQLGWLANAWYAAINLLTLFAVIVASSWRMDFAGFVAIAAVPPVVGHAAIGIHLLAKMRWRIASLPRPDTVGMMRLLRAGLPFTLPQLGALALSAMPPVLISAVLGPAAVTPWNMGQRLLGLFGQLQALLLAPLWPAFTEARSRGDSDWLRTSYRRSIFLSGAVVALPQLLFVFWGGVVIDFWGRGAVSVEWSMAAALGFWAAVGSMSQPPAFLLNSFGRALGQGIYGGLSVAIIIAFAPVVLRAGGSAGLAALAGAVFLLVNLRCVYREANAALQPGSTADSVGKSNAATAWLCRVVGYFRRQRSRRSVPVVIYKVDRLGDFVLALGAVQWAITRAGAANVLMILNESVRELAEREFPNVEKSYVRYDGDGGLAALRAAWSNPLARGVVRADTVICLRHQRGLFRERILAGLKAGVSIGCSEGGARQQGDCFTKPVIYRAEKSRELPTELRTHAAVLSEWSGEQVAAADVLPSLVSSTLSADFVLVCPFGSSEIRDYPVERWAAIVEGLRAAGRRVVFNAAAGDETRLHELVKHCGAVEVNVTERFSDYFVLIERAAVVITVETAAAHLAAALDKPAVILIGGGHFGKCGPWNRSARQVWLTHAMDCFGCDWSCVHEQPWCVRRIAVEDVVAAVIALPTAARPV
jgi:ADP-heptose:LPS heptosyltransferase/O-antigen/teichoic acid export membrane protein